jgi:hypothetical protein
MATATSTPAPWRNGYPTSDGKPMAETDWHRRELRLYDPAAARWLPTPLEMAAEAEAARQKAEAENERLRRELEALRRRLPKNRDW